MKNREISLARVITPSVVLALAMLALAVATTSYAGVNWSALPWAYTSPAIAACFIFLLIAIFFHLLSMRRRLESDPIKEILSFAVVRSRLLVLPALVTPMFLAAFTATKTAMAHLTGFHWDRWFTAMDAHLFGGDPWRWTHSLIGEAGTAYIGFFYTVVWGLTLAFSKVLVAIYGSRRFVGTFFLAMLMTWIVVGVILAYLLNSAGPVFVHLVDPTLGGHFAPLVEQLDKTLASDASVRTTQAYLSSAIFTLEAVKGGGVSAMPSMHIGAAAILIMAARGTLWIWPAWAFMLLTWLGSIHLGYHYATDGIPSVIAAVLCWRVAELYYSPRRQGVSNLVAAMT